MQELSTIVGFFKNFILTRSLISFKKALISVGVFLCMASVGVANVFANVNVASASDTTTGNLQKNDPEQNLNLVIKPIVVTINQYVNHIALDSAYNGLQSALSARGYLPNNIELVYANAQGSISNSAQISRHQASLNPDFMVAIATPAMQTNLKARSDMARSDIKNHKSVVAFLAVTDLTGMNIGNLDGQEDVIGVTDSPPIEQLFVLIKEVFGDLKTIGVLYNAGEINSVKTVDALKKIAAESNIDVKVAVINNTTDIKSAFARLSGGVASKGVANGGVANGGVDLIYLPQDNTVISALDNVVALAKKSGVPLVANDPTLVERGVMLALGANYFSSGEQLGYMIADLAQGKKLDSMIQNSNVNELRINDDVVDALGIKIPDSVLQDSRLVVDKK